MAARLVMPAAPKVAIIVVNWNGLDDTRACARSLQAQRYPTTEVYLVDNGSSDDSASLLGDEFPAFTHITNQTNLGFARANNEAMKRALAEGAEYILLLNNDTAVAPDFLRHLVAAAQADERIGMVVPKIYFHDRPDEIWFAGGRLRFREWFPFKHIGEGEKDFGQYDQAAETDFATACCVLVRAELIREVGMLDSIYGFYCEDVDWSLRALRAGWKIRYEPRATIWHRVNRSMARARIDPIYYSYRNIAIVARRHLGWWRALPVVWLVVCAACRDTRHAPASRIALMEAARDAVLGRTGIATGLGSSRSGRVMAGVVKAWSRAVHLLGKPAASLRRKRARRALRQAASEQSAS